MLVWRTLVLSQPACSDRNPNLASMQGEQSCCSPSSLTTVSTSCIPVLVWEGLEHEYQINITCRVSAEATRSVRTNRTADRRAVKRPLRRPFVNAEVMKQVRKRSHTSRMERLRTGSSRNQEKKLAASMPFDRTRHPLEKSSFLCF